MGSEYKNDRSDQIIKVGLEGFSGPNLAMLEYCLIGSGDFDLSEPFYSDVVIINGDQPLSVQELKDSLSEKYREKARILISIRDLDWDGFYVLKKPHSSEELLSLVTRAYEESDRSKNSSMYPNSSPSSQPLKNIENYDFFQSRELVRKRQADALKQKLMRGDVALSAADRLVQSIEDNLASEDDKSAHTAETKNEGLEQSDSALALDNSEALEEEKKPTAFRFEKPERISKELTEALILESCGNLPDIDLNKSEQLRRVFVNTEGMLIEKMKEAVQLSRKSNNVVEVVGLPGTMLVTPEPLRFIFSFSTDFMNQLALTKFGFGELSLRKLDEFHAEAGERLYDQDVESLIWEVAIWTARGRLFTGLDPHKSYQLQSQPDFEYFLPVPNGEDIAELWSERELSASDVVGILGVPQRFVFAFMSGIFSLGWFQT